MTVCVVPKYLFLVIGVGIRGQLEVSRESGK